MKTIKQFLENYETNTIKDVARYGCAGGSISELIYYKDTAAFHDEHEAEIWEMLFQDAQASGVTVMQLMASLNGEVYVASMDQLKNLLTWYAVEAVCNQIVEETTT